MARRGGLGGVIYPAMSSKSLGGHRGAFYFPCFPCFGGFPFFLVRWRQAAGAAGAAGHLRRHCRQADLMRAAMYRV